MQQKSAECRRRLGVVAALALMASACVNPEPGQRASAGAGGSARFDWFEYTGNDPALALPAGSRAGYRNPVLTGFYPDPSITQVGNDYYLVTSTFSYFPGIPVFHSRNLVDWKQIGNVIDRPGMLKFDGLGLSRGVFAPTIEHHNGTFYVANTCVDCGGNYIVTATNPAGPWSQPIWLPQVGGIDPSLFFDGDGKVYVINNDAPAERPRYNGHRAIWIREVDPRTFQSIGPAKVLIDGGVRPEDKPIWIEGPHLYRIGEWYYLWAAEGGTAVGHSQVVLRAKSVLGPFTPFEGNPILTQRHLDPARAAPITSVGHADLVQDAAGNWWATFLGVRPYEGDFYNTGRETFLAPVRWKDGWPIVTEGAEQVPYFGSQRPAVPAGTAAPGASSGNFTQREEFDTPQLALDWLMVRVPTTTWHALRRGAVWLQPRPVGIGDGGQPSMIGKRQKHQVATATTSVVFAPESGTEAGLTAFQSDEFFYALGLTRSAEGNAIVRLRVRKGARDARSGSELARQPVTLRTGQALELRIAANRDQYSFFYRPAGAAEWKSLAENQDGKILSTRTAGGFVGAIFGLYAEAQPTTNP